jgi:sulfhydrogenase subunit alpha
MTKNYFNKDLMTEFESSRFIEKILFTRSYEEAPIIASRVCGKNSIVHCLTAIKAIENACQITPSTQTVNLRKLVLAGQMIKSHTAFLCEDILPFFVGEKSIFDLNRSHPNLFKNAVVLKNYADEILEAFVGRSIHPITCVPGGFTFYPTRAKLDQLIAKSTSALESAKDLIQSTVTFEYPEIERKRIFGSLHQKSEYSVYEGEVWTSDNKILNPESYHKHIIEELSPHHKIAYASLDGKEVMVGPLSRLCLHMPKELRGITANLKINISSSNPFDNIIARALENYYFIGQSKIILDQLIRNGIKNEPIKQPREYGSGVAVCEAPEGMLIHYCELNNGGSILNYKIITPENQNLASLEKDLELLSIKSKTIAKTEKERLVKLLALSYNICPTCALH